MASYIAKRIGWGLLTLFLFVTMLFFLVNVLVPGDFTSQFIMTADQRAELRAPERRDSAHVHGPRRSSARVPDRISR